MFEQPRRTRCRACGTPILVVRSGPHRFVILDAETHPAGDIHLARRPDGWLATDMTAERWRPRIGRCFIAHVLTCQSPTNETGPPHAT